jgi:hypothetical protein
MISIHVTTYIFALLMQYQNHVQSLNVMFVKRHENIGIFFLVTVQSAKVNLPKYRITNCQNITINYNIFPRKWLAFMSLHTFLLYCYSCWIDCLLLKFGLILFLYAGISRDLRKSSTPLLSGNISLNTVSVCELHSAWSSNELPNAVPEPCSIVKRHENIGIF